VVPNSNSIPPFRESSDYDSYSHESQKYPEVNSKIYFRFSVVKMIRNRHILTGKTNLKV